jgi:hypothetical protein
VEPFGTIHIQLRLREVSAGGAFFLARRRHLENFSVQFQPLWNPKETARFIHASQAALRKWRRRGEGPAYVRVGRLIRYNRAAIEAWLMTRTVEPGKDSTTAGGAA